MPRTISSTSSKLTDYRVVELDVFTGNADPLAPLLADDDGRGAWSIAAVSKTASGKPCLILGRPKQARRLAKTHVPML